MQGDAPIGWALVLLAAIASCNAAGPASDTLPATFKKLLPLHTKLRPPKPGEWLEKHPEPGQTYAQYLHGRPARVAGKRRVIYVQPLGTFDAVQQKVFDRTAEFLGIYFNYRSQPARLCRWT